ncbi:hypothetical protein CVT26_015168 [Gymnopilus dilepis]|uniref:Uncharacterized protein n=1 Tax=Gymnopilus dilepis TaxID=231916 RepID=A0A409X051_9AGAR|nr:hypothetical protein CVT26_015168 [Gymnopilus dilepis]
MPESVNTATTTPACPALTPEEVAPTEGNVGWASGLLEVVFALSGAGDGTKAGEVRLVVSGGAVTVGESVNSMPGAEDDGSEKVGAGVARTVLN